MNPSCFSYTSLNSLVYAEGEPRIFLDFPINYWIHSCSNFSQHHFQSTPEGAFFYTVYFCLPVHIPQFAFLLKLATSPASLCGRWNGFEEGKRKAFL